MEKLILALVLLQVVQSLSKENNEQVEDKHDLQQAVEPVSDADKKVDIAADSRSSGGYGGAGTHGGGRGAGKGSNRKKNVPNCGKSP